MIAKNHIIVYIIFVV